jgi:SAM-dependent methyltransferase
MSNGGCKRVERGRLAYYQHQADASYWDDLWARQLTPAYFAPFAKGWLDLLEEPFTRWLPREGPILEAGCGTGQFVLGLRARGYDCIGIDYAERTVERVRAAVPDLPIFQGDVTRMQYEDGVFAGVISLGVVEHRYEGPEPFLSEMVRVLRPGGRLLVSVPDFNALRRRRHARGGYPAQCEGEFYQWAFPAEEFRTILRDHGLTVVAEHGYGHRKSMRSELPWLTRLPSLLSRAVMRIADNVPGLPDRWGHMRMYIAEKPASDGRARLVAAV